MESGNSPEQRQAVLLQHQLSPHELAHQESLIQERESEIREIETGIHELAEIFHDLGTLVDQQGGMLGASASFALVALYITLQFRQYRIEYFFHCSRHVWCCGGTDYSFRVSTQSRSTRGVFDGNPRYCCGNRAIGGKSDSTKNSTRAHENVFLFLDLIVEPPLQFGWL